MASLESDLILEFICREVERIYKKPANEVFRSTRFATDLNSHPVVVVS